MSYTLCKNDIPIEKDFVTFQEVFGDTLENVLRCTKMFVWGTNNVGQLGLGTTTYGSIPVQLGTSTDWNKLNPSHFYGVAGKRDGTLWTWGNNCFGQLGLGDRVHRSSPTQVGSLKDWKQISIPNAVKTDGTLWAWGNNCFGQLGLGDQVHKSSPVQVGAMTNWASVSNGMAIKTDGTLWAWGHNAYGRLGLGDQVHRSSPVQVGALTNWKSVISNSTHTAALKTDGTLWTWGFNCSLFGVLTGQLGLGDFISRSSPVQVGTLTNWKELAVGSYHTAALKTDGTLWTWGNNGYIQYVFTVCSSGALGLGDKLNRSSPTQVGALTNWCQLTAGRGNTLAIKADGTLWVWGYNEGSHGLGDASKKSSPTQVGNSQKWNCVATSGQHTFATQSLI